MTSPEVSSNLRNGEPSNISGNNIIFSMNRNTILIDNSNSNSNFNYNMNIDQNMDDFSEDNNTTNRDFDTQLDEIYDNLNYLITTEK